MNKEITERNKKILLIFLISGCFLSSLNQTLLNVALSSLMDIFDVTAATVQWSSTGFMLVNGVLVPITAFLMQRFTTRQLFISSMFFCSSGLTLCLCDEFWHAVNVQNDSSHWCWNYYTSIDDSYFIFVS